MSSFENLNRPEDTIGFTYDEAGTLLRRLDYKEDNRGRSSGSRVAFVSIKTNHIIRLHKPHPTNILRMY